MVFSQPHQTLHLAPSSPSLHITSFSSSSSFFALFFLAALASSSLFVLCHLASLANALSFFCRIKKKKKKTTSPVPYPRICPPNFLPRPPKILPSAPFSFPPLHQKPDLAAVQQLPSPAARAQSVLSTPSSSLTTTPNTSPFIVDSKMINNSTRNAGHNSSSNGNTDSTNVAGANGTTKKDPRLATIQALLGPEIASWGFSDSTLTAALELAAEKERTQQEYLKLQTKIKTSELLNTALRNNVPMSLIPLLLSATGPIDLPDGVSVKEYIQQRTGKADNSNSPEHNSKSNINTSTFKFQQPSTIYENTTATPTRTVAKPQKFKRKHHASMSALPTFSSGASTVSNGSGPQVVQYPTPSKPAWQTAPNIMLSQQNKPPNPASPTTSVHHIIQFHHWQPNSGNNINSSSNSPNPASSTASAFASNGKKRRSSVTDGTADEAAADGRASSFLNKKRGMHHRHQSESVIRKDPLSNTSFYPSGAAADGGASSRVSPSSSTSSSAVLTPTHASSASASSTASSNNGFEFLASAAEAESKKLSAAAAAAAVENGRKSHKQQVNFMISQGDK